MFLRPQGSTLLRRLGEPRRFIQVVAGARQVGKTTMVRQILDQCGRPASYVSADEPTLRGREWIEQQWEAARIMARGAGRKGAVLAIDEIQKITNWSETVKRLWDEDTASAFPLRIVLLGSAPLLISRGLTESLAGRFELLRLPHWSYSEMKEAFGWSLPRYIFHGGYPGAAPLVSNHDRWARYVKDALVEATISRDVLLLTRVDKPVLLRRLFELACAYSGQILSYQKMLGQLQDVGNTTTLAHYLDLLAGAGMVTGLQKFAGDRARQRGSSPKLQVLNTALMTAQSGLTLREAQADPSVWGRLVESAVGAHLLNAAAPRGFEVYYWRDRNLEVDFVVKSGQSVTAIEVKSVRRREALPGMAAFAEAFHPQRKLLIGGDAIAVEKFLSRPVADFLHGVRS
jgi:uncharacterized protein